MDLTNTETDTSYLDSAEALLFDHSPWEQSSNPFERRMAMNLAEGCVIYSIDIASLGRVLGTATRLRRQSISVDLAETAEYSGRFRVKVTAIHSYYLAPANTDSAANFPLALKETSKHRSCFFVSVTPENQFWVHSEQAKPANEQDWADALRQCHTSMAF